MFATIMLGEVLRQLDSGNTCSLASRTFDFRKNRGGEYVEFAECRAHHHQTHAERLQAARNVRYHKNPNHFENSTRNVVVLPSGDIRKVHIRLIRKFKHLF